MRVLVVSNMRPDRDHPERGQFVRDQVAALAGLGVEVQLHEIPPGPRALAGAFASLPARYRRTRFDVVHAHFSLAAAPALSLHPRARGLTLHGTDVLHPRTRQATRALLPLMDLLVAVSASLATQLPGAGARRRAMVIPCGVNLTRFHPIPRASARSQLGLPADRPLLLFPADPARPAKRHDLALTVAAATGAELLCLGGVAPDRVPLLINAANAVVLPSDREGFGLAVLEALACDVPVLATPVGGHPEALADIPGTLCEPFDLVRWTAAVKPHLAIGDPRIQGRARAGQFSVERMAETLAAAWRHTLHAHGSPRGPAAAVPAEPAAQQRPVHRDPASS